MAAVGAFTSMDQAEDLKAFERRFVEQINALGPYAKKWRLILFATCFVAALTSMGWFLDQRTSEISLTQSLVNHQLFSFSCLMLITLLLMGAHKRIFAQNIILSRCRMALQDFNMSCDERGRLILKPRPVKEVDSYMRLYPGHG